MTPPPPTTATPPSERLAPSSPESIRQARPAPAPIPPDSPGAYLDALRAHRRLVVLLPLTFTVIAIALALPRPRTYLARAAFVASEPQSASGSLGALSSIASQLGIPALSAVASSSASGSASFYGDLLKSQALVHAVVTATYDASEPGEFGGVPFKGTLVEYFKSRGKTTADREMAAIKQFSRRTMVVAVDRPTGIVRLTVLTKNRQLSGLVSRRLLELVNDFNLRRRQTQAGAEREFGAHRARAALDTLHAAEVALADFRATNIDFSRSPRLGTREAELQRRVSLAQQIYTTVAQRYELASIEAVRNTPVITVLDGPEGLVEAQPRYTIIIVVGAFALGLVLACGIALYAERDSMTGARVL